MREPTDPRFGLLERTILSQSTTTRDLTHFRTSSTDPPSARPFAPSNQLSPLSDDYGSITEFTCRLNSHNPFQYGPPSEDGLSSIASFGRSVPEPYYSNEDIGILHTIATDAQEILGTAPSNRKPKPILALFRASEKILPQHGIDPEEDRHLSRFLFRLGGEEGDGSFVEKLQAILGREGIVLEFGEDESEASVRGAPSPARSDAHSTRPQPIIHRSPLRTLGRPGAHAPVPWLGRLHEQRYDYDFDDVYEDDEEDEDEYDNLEEPQADPETEQAMQIARRAAMSSALNKWRTAAARAQRNQGTSALTASMSRLGLGNQQQQPASGLGALSPQLPASGHRHANPTLSAGSSQGRAGQPQSGAPKPSLVSIFDRWREAALQNHNRQRLSPVEEQSPEATTRVVGPPGKEGKELPSLSPQQDRDSRAARTTSLREALENRVNARQAHQKEAAQVASASSAGTPPQPTVAGQKRPAKTPEDQSALRAQEDRDIQRAARARQIFLASRVFNHWADKTARRLEREAVARRHMIRFRCFKGWSQMPASREPAVDHLRVATAAQKLKRACLQNEEQLRVTAAAAAQSYRLKKIHAVLDRWYYHLAEDVSQLRLAHRTRMKTVTRWFLRAEDDADLSYAVSTHRRQADGVNALIRWQGEAERGAMRDDAASQLGGRHLAWKCLRDWWDQAETGRRSRDYRQHSLARQASHVFDIWNLQARAQAFVWHTQYRTVSRLFEFWLERSQENAENQRQAHLLYEITAKSRCVDKMRDTHREQSMLQYQADRASLYIRSHRLLAVFDAASTRREESERQQIRRHLMRRYEEVSRARKKRNFFNALDCWRDAAAKAQQQSETARRIKRGHEERRVLGTIEQWSVQAAEAQQSHEKAQTDALRGRFFQALTAWTEAAADHEFNQQVAHHHDSDRKKRQVQKVWANATLQHGSHAHTATALRTRYDRDKRNKAFNVLLRFHAKEHNTRAHSDLATRTKRLSLGTSSLGRNKTHESSSRRLLFGASQGTPSRPPTSRHTPTPRRSRVDLTTSNMASLKRPTPIREEAGEGSRLLSDDEQDLPIQSPAKSPRGLGSLMGFPKLPSTTPKGPIPPHVENEILPQRTQLGTGRPSQSFGSFGQSNSQDRPNPTPNSIYGPGKGLNSRSTPGLFERSMSGASATSISARQSSGAPGTSRQQSVATRSGQPSAASQRSPFGLTPRSTGPNTTRLPGRIFPSPERKEDDEDLWGGLEEFGWEDEGHS